HSRDMRRPFFRLLGEVFTSLFELDGRAYRTIYYLFTKPGFLSSEYVSGRRMSYTPRFGCSWLSVFHSSCLSLSSIQLAPCAAHCQRAKSLSPKIPLRTLMRLWRTPHCSLNSAQASTKKTLLPAMTLSIRMKETWKTFS
ncbi:MAG: DUF3667 domain-containing protein, partial [Gammaproteobacteria bacterium]|nr:DUF3667 domain-containing protein [Gammaproteobacteria bacterium]